MINKLIFVRFLGGLGNQLFQYALGRHLSLIHGRPLRFDTSVYAGVEPDAERGDRVFGLGHFCVSGRAATSDEMRIFSASSGQSLVPRCARLAYRSIPYRLVPYRYRRYIVQGKREYWRFQESLLGSPLREQVLIEGYWQTEKYFSHIAATIRNDLRLKLSPTGLNSELLTAISEVDSVAVHVRHGDNARGFTKEMGVLPLEYYDFAAGLIKKKVRRPYFFVFSDDLSWAEKNLKLPGPTTFVGHNGDQQNYEDLRLMSACKHHINANSTFSWWGAWLGQKEDQLVIAPDRYFLQTNNDYCDHYPPSWNLLPVRP